MKELREQIQGASRANVKTGVELAMEKARLTREMQGAAAPVPSEGPIVAEDKIFPRAEELEDEMTDPLIGVIEAEDDEELRPNQIRIPKP